MSYSIASDLSYECLQARRLRGELGAQAFDSTHARLRTITGYNPRVFVADVEEWTDSPNPQPLTIAVGERDTEGQ